MAIKNKWSLSEWLNFQPRQNEFLQSCFQYKYNLYGGAKGPGKLLAIDTPIPTPDGWKRIVDLLPGDTVFGSDGQTCTVQWCSIPEVDKTYDLYFSDGSVMRAGASHQWITETKADRDKSRKRNEEYRKRRRETRPLDGTGSKPWLSNLNANRVQVYKDIPKPTIKTTQEIVDTLHPKPGESNHAILTCGPLELPERELLVDPYVFGAWLGDGSKSGSIIIGADQEIFDEIEKAGFTVNQHKHPQSHGIPGLITKLKDMGVFRHKHIPLQYLRASIKQRLALLQGLMDTDGTCDTRGTCSFTNTNKELVDGVFELMVSLGIKVTIREGIAKLYGKDCGAVYDMCFITDLPVFRLKRKLERQKVSGFNGVHKRRYIVSAIEVTPALMCCIEVDSPDHTYLAGRSMIPTHNSYALRGILVALHLYWAGLGIRGVTTALICQTYKQLQDRHIAKMREWPEDMGRVFTGQLGLGFYFTDPFGGGAILLRNLEQDKAGGEKSSRYKSAEFAAIAVDELTETEQRKTFDNLRSSLRFPGVEHTVFLAATNPDGPGLEWVRELWIEHKFPPEYIEAGINREFNFVPALPQDNKYLSKEYWDDLKSQDKETQEAWLKGNWYVFSGRAFKEFRPETHVIPLEEIPEGWVRFTGHDYGLSAPFCCLWGAKDLSTGRVVVYKELYEILSNDRLQAKKILYMSEDKERYIKRWADPHFWDNKSDTSGSLVSAAKIYGQNGVFLSRANNDRSAGKRQIMRLLSNLGDGKPGLMVMESCPHLISQLMKAIHDPKNPEDIYTSNHYADHAIDALRYLLSGESDLIKKPRNLKAISQSVFANKALSGYM